jgi:hypothetical protein
VNAALTPGAGPLDARVPFPGILQEPTGAERSIGSSWYNAFQLKLEERANHGLSYLISYTWSKSEDTGCSGYEGVEGCQIADPYHVRSQKSVSSYDVPQVLSAAYVWQVPFGEKRAYLNSPGIASKILGDWQLNGIFTASSGGPQTVYEGDQANTGNSFGRPDQVGNPIPTNRSLPYNWFNVNAFALSPDCRVVPASECRYGTLGRNTLRGPGFWNLDFSVFRDFPISEKLGKIELRGEFFNFFNHTTYLTNTFPDFGLSILSGNAFDELLNTRPARQTQFAAKWIF